MIRKTARWLMPTLAVVGALTVGFSKTQMNESEHLSKIILITTDMTKYNGIVLSNIVSISKASASNFDDIVKSTAEFHQTLDTAELVLLEIDADNAAKAAVVEARNLALDRDEKIEQLKSSSAIVRNSYMQLPAIINHIQSLLAQNQDRKTQRQLILIRDALLAQVISPEQTVTDSVLEYPERILNHVDDIAGKGSLQALTNHIKIVVKTKQEKDRLIKEITSVPIFEAIRNLNEIVLAADAVKNKHLNVLRWILLLLTAILVPTTIFVVQWQLSLNKRLDQKVRERTIKLQELNDDLKSEARDRQEAQRAKDEAHQQMISSSKFAALGEMAAGVAHEINNPLAVIQMRARQMQRLLNTEDLKLDLVKDYAKAIGAMTDKIAIIVKGLQTFSRNADKDPFEPVSLKETINDTLALCNEKFRHHNVDLKIDPILENICVLGRKTQISQVLLNLLNNAHDAVESLSEKWVRVCFVESPDEIQIKVVDSGTGIPPAIQEKIMQPFFSTKEVGKGTGLGLSISNSIIAEHGGSISIDQFAAHTTFTVTLPKLLQSLQTG